MAIAYVQILTIFLSMLDWCRNLQPMQENHTELTLIATTPLSQPLSTRNLLPPKFTGPTERRLNSQSRKGIKTHFARVGKLDKDTQTSFQEGLGKVLKEGWTQTVDPIVIHPLGSKKNSMSISRQQSPLGRLDRTLQPKGQPLATERTLMQVSKGTLDCRNELNRETKASFNMLESQEQAWRFDDRSYHQVRNVESYHLPTHQPLLTVPQQPLMRSRLPHQHKQLPSHRMVQSIRNSIVEQHESVTFSQKYKAMLRNVQSEFKLSEKKQSERKIRYTPEKRILFHERETIISKYGDSHQEDRSMRVEESLVYDRDVRAGFATVGRAEVGEGFSLSLAVERTANVMVSIKEVPVRRMAGISEELLVYREMEERRVRVEGVLDLYQTQIDKDLYLFIKEPYTLSLAQHLPDADLPSIETQIRSILQTMERHGFTLKQELRVEDFVVCCQQVKLQNAAIFQFGQRKKIEIESAISGILDEILQHVA